MIVRSLVALVALTAGSAASAQWVPGTEIAGQQVQVQTNGILNTVYFENGGVARISSPSGATVVDATWTADAGKICLQTSNIRLLSLSRALHRGCSGVADQRLRRAVDVDRADDLYRAVRARLSRGSAAQRQRSDCRRTANRAGR